MVKGVVRCLRRSGDKRKTRVAKAKMNPPPSGRAPARAKPVEPMAGSEEERVAALVIATAATLLESQESGVPKTFVEALFSHAVPEDVVRYDAREIAALAQSAWGFFAERKRGEPKIRFDPPATAAGDHLRQITVLEIVNDDMPFLVDSVLDELAERGVDIQLVAHPVVSVTRNRAGRLSGFGDPPSGRNGTPRESVIHIHVARIDEEARRAEIMQAIAQVLDEVRVCVQDWRPMVTRVQEVIKRLKTNPPPVPTEEVSEAVAFLEWLVANNFTVLGVRNYAFSRKGDALEPQFETSLGLLRAREVSAIERGTRLVVTPAIREFLDGPNLLIVTKSTRRSRVHRHAHMDYVG